VRRFFRPDARAVMLDREDKVVRPALIWCDVRTEAQTRELTEKLVGNVSFSSLAIKPWQIFTLTKCLWVRENEPEN